MRGAGTSPAPTVTVTSAVTSTPAPALALMPSDPSTRGFTSVPAVGGAGGVVVIYDIGGTVGEPKLVHWLIKDI